MQRHGRTVGMAGGAAGLTGVGFLAGQGGQQPAPAQMAKMATAVRFEAFADELVKIAASTAMQRARGAL
jgi:hypothetical protein